MISEFNAGQLYSNEEIFRTLKVANAGGIRASIRDNSVVRMAIMTSIQDFHISGENPYHDRLEGDILTYTAAGKIGEQTLAGINYRIVEQKELNFPIYGFVLIASRRDKSVGPKRWKYIGLLEYVRHYPDMQLDSSGKVRKVWLFELRVHQNPSVVPVMFDFEISNRILTESKIQNKGTLDDEVVHESDSEHAETIEELEQIRGKLLMMDPQNFEFFIKDLLVFDGFSDVCVTKYSADGGIDVHAKASGRMWIFESTFVQIQAKRWLHSVGRKEIAELRGSLKPFAKGVVITTSHFTKAALNEAEEEGKNPISLIDGLRLSKVIIDVQFPLGVKTSK